MDMMFTPLPGRRLFSLKGLLKFTVLLFVLLFSTISLWASHIVGGEIYYEYLGNNTYRVKMTLYRDCYNGVPDFDQPNATIGIYNNGNYVRSKNIRYLGKQMMSPSITQPCVSPPSNICYEVGSYEDTLILPDRPGGYLLAYDRCCRNMTITNITNPDTRGLTITADIPERQAADAYANNNPVFKKLAPMFVCRGYPFTYDFGVNDANGDSVIYQLCNPYNGERSNSTDPYDNNRSDPPYAGVPYAAGYSSTQPFGAGSPVTFNTQTGQFSVTPSTAGQFVFAVCVIEFRNGQYLGTTRRDVQVNVTNCPYVLISSAATPRTTCANNQAEFTNNSVGAGGYSWDFGDPSTASDNSTLANPTYTYPFDGTYTVRLVAFSSQNASCSDTSYTTIQILPELVADFTPAIDQCNLSVAFTNTTNTVGGGYTNTYFWQFGDATTSTATSPTHVYAAAGTYVVTLTATNNAPDPCIDVITKTVVLYPPPVANAGPDRSICNGQSAVIGTSSIINQSYVWSPSTGLSNIVIPQPTANPTTTTTYTVTVTQTQTNCKTTDQVVVTVNPLPFANAGPDQSACAGTCRTIGSAAAAGNTYAWTPPAGLSATNVAQPSACPTSTSTYTVTVTTTATGCSATDAMVFTVNSIPVADAGPDRVICSGKCQTVGTSATAGMSYSWTPTAGLDVPTNAQPQACPTITTTYTLLVTNNTSGCTTTDLVVVTVNPLPPIDAGADQVICNGQARTIGTPAVAGLTYAWSPATALSSTNTATATANPTISTVYTLTVTNPVTGCSTVDQVTVSVNQAPPANAGSDRNICFGNSVLIGSTGGPNLSFTWTPGTALATPTISNPTASPTVTTTYQFVVTNTNTGCTASDEVIVNVNPRPPVDAGADRSICNGQTTLLGTAQQPGVNYSWTPTTALDVPTNAQPNANPISTTSYTVVATNAATGCSTSDNIVVTVNPVPIADAGIDKTICLGNSTTIGSSAQVNMSYAWSPTIGLTLPTDAMPTAAPSVTTTYNLTVTNTGNSCTRTDQVIVTVNPLPTADGGPNVTTCAGAPIMIGTAAVPGMSYLWSPAGTLNSPSIAQPLATTSTTSTYYVTVTNNSTGCVAYDANGMVVFVNPLPTFTPGGGTICNGNNIQLGEANVAGYSYNWSPGTGLNSTVVSNPIASPATSTTYTVTVTNTATNCSITRQAVVNVNPLPTNVDAGPDKAICFGDNTIIGSAPNGNQTYIWGPATGLSSTTSSNPIATPTNTTVYVLTVTNTSTTCTATDQVTVTVNSIPQAEAGPAQTICRGFGVQIGVAPQASVTYSWTPVTGLSNANLSNPIATPTTSTTYFLIATNSTTGCYSTDQTVVYVIPLPVADAGPDKTICKEQLAIIGSGSDPGSLYSWTPPIGLTTPTSATPQAAPPSTTTYTLRITNSGGCTASDAVVVNINPNPPVDAGPNKTVCFGKSVQIGTPDAGGIGYAWTPTDYLNNSNFAEPTATPSLSITYILAAKYNATGCTSYDTMSVKVNALPPVAAGPDQVICQGDTATLGSAGTPGYNYQWSPVIGLSNGISPNPEATPSITSSYVVTVTDAFTGCTISDGVLVTVNSRPNANAGPDANICEGTSVTIGMTPVAGFSYQWTPANGLSNTAISNPVASPSTNTTYFFSMVNASSFCRDNDTVVVSVKPLPTQSAGPDQFICAGQSVSIGTAPIGSTSYSWSPASGLSSTTAANPTATPTASIIYTVVVTNTTTGCSTSDQVAVNILGLPSVGLSMDKEICSGGSTDIGTASQPGLSYAWSPASSLNNPNLSNPLASPSVTTTYICTVTNVSNCTGTVQVVVTVNSLPGVTAGPDRILCFGASTTIGGPSSVGRNYFWTPSTFLSNVTASDPTVITPTQSITYTLVTTNEGNGCNASDQVVVTVNPLPVADAGPDVQSCLGSSTTTIGTPAVGGMNYNWSPIDGLSNSTNAQPIATPTATRTYTLIVTDAATLCTASDKVIVTVAPAVTANAGPDKTICLNNSVTIGTPPTVGGLTYTWSPTSSLSLANTAEPIAQPITTTTYSLTVTNGVTGCSAVDPAVVVNVNPLPTAVAGPDRDICVGSSTTLGQAALPNATYIWSPTAGLNDPTSSAPIATPTTTTVYRVTVSLGTGCTNTSEVKVNLLLNQAPIANAGPDKVLCEFQSYTMGVSSQPGYGYGWNPSAGLSSGFVSNPTILSASVGTVTYILTVTDQKGCTATDNAVITVNDIPITDPGPDKAICRGESVQIGSGSEPGINYLWSPSLGLSNTGISNPIANPTASTTYVLNVSNPVTGCGSADVVVVTINPLPGADAGLDKKICPGQTVTLGHATNPNYSYAWSPATALSATNVAEPQATPPLTLTYTVEVTDNSSLCKAKDSVVVTVNPQPPVDAGPDQFICSGRAKQIGSSPYPGVSYSWLPTDYLNNSNISNPTAAPTSTTTYYLSANFAASGCSAIDTVVVNVDPIPNVTAGIDQVICMADTAQLGAAPLNGYLYQWSPVNGLNRGDIANPKSSPTQTTSYVVTITNSASGCSTSDGVLVSINQLPKASAGPDAALCSGNSVLLGATKQNGLRYKWTPATYLNSDTLAQPTASPTANISYILVVTNKATNCISRDTMKITVGYAPVAFAGADTTICNGDNASIGTAPKVGTIYNWVPASFLSATNIANPTASPTATQEYTLTATDSLSGCFNVDRVLVKVNQLPFTDAGADKLLCFGQSTPIGNDTVPGYTYLWTPNVALDANTKAKPWSSTTSTTVYTMEYKDILTGCKNIDQMAVLVQPTPMVDAGNNRVICAGASTQLGDPGNPAAFSYAWLPASSLNSNTLSEPIATPLQTTTYYVTVISTGISCSNYDSVVVTVNTAEFDITGDKFFICKGDSVMIGGQPKPLYNFSWTPLFAISSGNTASVTAAPSITTTYTVKATDLNSGCFVEKSIVVNVNDYPVGGAGLDKSVCRYDSVRIGQGPFVPTYEYIWTPTTGLDDPYTAVPNAAPTNTTTYSVMIRDRISGCFIEDTNVVSIIGLPSAAAGRDTTICLGKTARIGSAPSLGKKYKWTPSVGLDNDTVATPRATPLVTTTYILSMLDLVSGCSGKDTVVVSINPVPKNVPLPTSDTTCFNLPITIGVVPDPNLTYKWSPGIPTLNNDSIGNPTATVAVNTTFTVTVSFKTTGCGTTYREVVRVIPYPVLNPASDAVVCIGDSVQIGPPADPGVNYRWTPSKFVTDSSSSQTIVFPKDSTDFILGVSDALTGMCVSYDTVNVAVHRPDFYIHKDTSICRGAVINIGDAPAANHTYLWSPVKYLNSSVISNPQAKPDSSITYYVTVTDNNFNCVLIDSVHIDIKSKFPINVGNDTSVCYGSSVRLTLNIPAPAQFKYMWSPGATLSDSTVFSPFANPKTTQTYIPTITDPVSNCSYVAELVVVVKPLPEAIAGFDATVCPGNTVNLGAVGSETSTYTWTPPDGLSSANLSNPTATVTQSTTYILTVVDTMTCVNHDTVVVSLINVIAGPDQPQYRVCKGDSLTVRVIANAKYRYVWTPPIPNLPDTATQFTILPQSNVTYSVRAYQFSSQGDSCSGTFTVPISISPLKLAIDLNPSDTSCRNTPHQVTALVNYSDPDNRFHWSSNPNFTDTLNLNKDLTSNIGVLTAKKVSNLYFVRARNNYCTARDSITLYSDTVRIALDPITLCAGRKTTFSVQNLDNVQLTYDWEPKALINSSPTQQSILISPTQTVSYSILVTNNAGCTSSLSSKVLVSNPGETRASASRYEINLGETVRLRGQPENERYSYQWSPVIWIVKDTLTSRPTVKPRADTVYTLNIIDPLDSNHCLGIDTVRIRVNHSTPCQEPYVYIPNAFSPNNDGVNDSFRLRGLNLKEVQLMVFDRWGEKVYETTDKDSGWDGTYKGKQLEPSVYVFYVKATCNNNDFFIKKGNVTLIR